MREISTKTDCQTPCKYLEYAVVEGPKLSAVTAYSYFAVDLWMTSTDITVITKIPVYPWTSLMAEFGGTFSLFFGLSVMSIWNAMKKQLSNIIGYYQM